MNILNDNSLENQLDVVYADQNENIVNYLEKEPFFTWCRENIGNLNDDILKVLSSNLLLIGDKGKNYFEIMTKALDNTKRNKYLYIFNNALSNKSRLPISYEDAELFGYKGRKCSGIPIKNVVDKLKATMYKNRGLSFNDKGKLQLNQNVFAEYILTRLYIVNFEGKLFIYDKKGVYINIQEDFLKKICRNILHEAERNIWKKGFENEYFDALKKEMIYVKEMNHVKKYLNLKNGILDLDTMELKEHSPQNYYISQLKIEYNTEAKCPMFINFLKDIFENDEERINLIQEIMRYSMYPEIKIQKAFIFYGSGSNGKSVLAEIMRRLCGAENVSNVSLNKISSRFGLEPLPDKLLNISAENEFSKKFDTESFKMLTGGDATNVDRKNEKSINVELTVKLVILLNKLMDTYDDTDGFYRRLQIIPFNRKYIEKKNGEEEKEGILYMDKSLKNNLIGELDGILIWALKGLERLKKNEFDLTYSKVCEEVFDEYTKKQNPVIEFFRDMIEVYKCQD